MRTTAIWADSEWRTLDLWGFDSIWVLRWDIKYIDLPNSADLFNNLKCCYLFCHCKVSVTRTARSSRRHSPPCLQGHSTVTYPTTPGPQPAWTEAVAEPGGLLALFMHNTTTTITTPPPHPILNVSHIFYIITNMFVTVTNFEQSSLFHLSWWQNFSCLLVMAGNLFSIFKCHLPLYSKETIHIISLEPISKKRAPKSIH